MSTVGRMDRRTFLGLAVVAACSGSRPRPPAPAKSIATSTTATTLSSALGPVAIRLPWVPDVESAGEFLAVERSYFTQEGFTAVNLIPGGPSATHQEDVVASGGALLAITSLDAAAAAVARGTPVVVIGAQYQKSPSCIVSLASSPLSTPTDLLGKTIGVPSADRMVMDAFVKANGIDATKVRQVDVQFDPAPLASGDVDGWLGSITNEPVVLGSRGTATATLLLNDFGLPQVGNVFIVSSAALKTSRAAVRAAVTAEIKGWRDALADPDAGAALAVNKYGTGLALAAEQAQSRAQNSLIGAPPLFAVDLKAQQASIKTLALTGTKATLGRLFDMSILDEVYRARPALRGT
jgi:ABC-type nitrate/sulfonate/bicarbonate transport system substrate-binding protein